MWIKILNDLKILKKLTGNLSKILWISSSLFHYWIKLEQSPVCTSRANKEPFAKWKNMTGKNDQIPIQQTYLNKGSVQNPPIFTDRRIELNSGVGDLASFGGTELSKKQVVYMDPSYVSPMELLMPLNRRMSDCDKLIDPFCGNTSVLITGNAVQLAHIRSLTCSHNNKRTQSCLFFPLLIFFTLFNAVYRRSLNLWMEKQDFWTCLCVIKKQLASHFSSTCFDFLSALLHILCALFSVVHFCMFSGQCSLTCASTLVSFLVCSAVWLNRFVPISIIVAVWLCTAVCWIWTMSCFMLSCM